MAKEIPVYLFVGFLEAGKTTFIQETFEDVQFDSGENTLLLLCEDGEEEYIPERFAFPGVTVATIREKAELNAQNLNNFAKQAKAERVVIEYNGMWQLDELAAAVPANWRIFQCIACADSNTALAYARENAMRGLFLDKLARSEMIVFNRAEVLRDEADRLEIHKLVRQVSRRCDIAYEYTDGTVEYDDIPDPLPFDLDADVIEIGPEDFGVWYMDCNDEPQKYKGKTVTFLAQVCQTPRVAKNQFVPGRFAMTCCADDIEFIGYPCTYDKVKELEQRNWITVTAKVDEKFHPIYDGKGPVLTAILVKPAEKPLNDVVMFS